MHFHRRAFLFALLVLPMAQPFAQESGSPQPILRDSLERWIARASNAGRWGATDELGTLNHIGASVRRRAAALVREGLSVSMAHDVVPGPNPRAIAPIAMHFWAARDSADVTWGLDSTKVLFHGWAYSHIDALSHTVWRNKMYNNVSVDALSSTGAKRLGIQTMSAGIVARAVLVDMPTLLGIPYLNPGQVITVAHLQRWERQTGIRIGTGDVVLIRTGRWAREAALGSWDVTQGTAGPHPMVALFLHERGAAALGGDVSNEFYPSLVPGVSDPLHEIALAAMGMPLMDNLDLEEAARIASTRKRWAFMFVAAPLRIRGGSGSLLNPLAIF